MQYEFFLIATLATLFGVFFINYFISRSIIHPASAYTIIWLIQILGLWLFKSRFIETSATVLLIIILGVILFSFGAHTKIDLSHFGKRGKKFRVAEFNSYRYFISLIVITVCFVQQFMIFNELTYEMELGAALVYVRSLITVESEDIYGIFKYGNTFGMGILLLMILSFQRGGANKYRVIIFAYILVATAGMGFLSTGRGQLVQVFILLSIAYIIGGFTRSIGLKMLKSISFLSLIMFIVFWQMGGAMGKASDLAIDAVLDVISYQFSPLPALSVHLASTNFDVIGGDGGARTFRFIFAIMNRIGMEVDTPKLIEEFVNVPHPTNIYTIYLMPLRDFGWIGFFLYPVLLGVIHGFIYRLGTCNVNSDYAKYILIISYLPLLQSIGGDAYFSLLSTWIQFAIIGLLFTTKKYFISDAVRT